MDHCCFTQTQRSSDVLLLNKFSKVTKTYLTLFTSSSSAVRKRLEQVENGGCDRDASSMGSRSSSSGTTPGFG